MSKSHSTVGEKFERLVSLMERLRSPEGCPWDREQSFDTIKPYLLEETYEVMEAIDARNWSALADELGDLLLQVVFFAQMASEQNSFAIADSIEAINQKLIRRHPHVFGNGTARTADEVKTKWDEIKAEENKSRQAGRLESVPRSMPALVEALQISTRAAGAGFEWSDVAGVHEKLDEEIAEFRQAERQSSREAMEHELGDLLFTLVNVARFYKIDPEQALRKTNARFRLRFAYVERRLAERGRSLEASGIEEMESLWQEAKRSIEP